MLIFKILFDEVDRGPRHEKKKKHFLTHHLNGINISLFLKKCYRWLKLITYSYTCREYNMAIDDYVQKRWLFVASK